MCGSHVPASFEGGWARVFRTTGALRTRARLGVRASCVQQQQINRDAGSIADPTVTHSLPLSGPMTGRTLCTSPFRSLALGQPRAYISTYAPLRANGTDPQDSHGSVPSSRRLRPRDRLQFTEASEREQSKDATSERDRSPEVQAGSSAGPSPLPPVQDPPTPINTEGGELVISAPLSDLPPLHSHHIPLSRVPFSTHRFVRDLEHAEVPRQLATDLMKATRDLLLREEERAQQELLNRQDMENVSLSVTDDRGASSYDSTFRAGGVSLHGSAQRAQDRVSSQVAQRRHHLAQPHRVPSARNGRS